MAEELVDGADVMAALEQVRGKGVPERMAGYPLVDSSLFRRIGHRALNDGLVQVMASLVARV